MAAVRGAFLPERVDGRADEQGERSGGDAEGYSRAGRSRSGTTEGEQVAVKLKEMKLADAAAIVVAGIEETLYYYTFPREHWRSLRTNNPLERLLREVRRRTRAVGAFPDGKSALMLAAARLRHVAGTNWGTAAVSGHEPPIGSERSGMNAPAKTFGSPRGSRAPPHLCFNKCAKNSGHYPQRQRFALP